MLSVQRSIGNSRSIQRQTLPDKVWGDGTWAYLWIVNQKYANSPKFPNECSIASTATPARDSVGILQVSTFVDFLNGSRLTIWRCRWNTRSSQRQTLSWTVSGDGKSVYLWIGNGTLTKVLKLQGEYSTDPTASPVRDNIRRWQVSILVNC